MDRDSFEALWHAHYGDILAFCLRRLGDRQEAADATADAFLVAWRRSDEIPEHARPWLYGVALKVIANRRRGERRRDALAIKLGQTPPGFESLPDEQPGEVLAAFRELAPGDQEVLSLIAWEELTPAEAAQALSIPVARFSVRLHRAKRRLRRLLAATDLPHSNPITEAR
ncbi:MAG TPA: sigma-70 family RNA polymerase sigma factor [Thermoleophilaceae bacterium]|jgi:RNA polymerase sigma-70 factor (ECF subfamily)